MVHISEIQQFPEFLETFLYYFGVQIFESFAWMESAPVFNFLQSLINLTSPKSPQLRFVVKRTLVLDA